VGAGLIVELCMNPDVIRGLYDDEFVQDRYADSGYYGFIDRADIFYLAAHDGDRFVCCALCVLRNLWDIEVHLCIPGEHRRLGYQFSSAVCDFLFANTPINRISTTVVSLFPQVANFAKKLGFTYEGTVRGACHRDGDFLDLWHFGLVRGEKYGRK